METCYVEGEELERTWKTTRRQRLKEQEQKVWDEFVQEKDVVRSIFKDNPYQFLHELPESCLQELMEAELQKARKEVEQEELVEPPRGDGDHETAEGHVTFAEHTEQREQEQEQDREDCDMFHIFDDDRDDPSGPSGPEDEGLNNGSLSSPCTVRERDGDMSSPEPCRGEIADESSENVSNVIESSIYCAKVKDLRIKIHEEMLAIISSLDRQDVMTAEREEVARTCRISAEFSTRFNRIYMYQLKRQMQDLSRGSQRAPPLARHTHFHAQMVRVASLHQQLLQALQVFHKSMSSTACLKQSAGLLHALGAAAREVSALGAATPAPPAMSHVARLYQDEMLSTCDKLDEAVCEYSVRMADYLSTTDNNTNRSLRKSKKKRKRGTAMKPMKSSEAEGRLSMYSLDTMRPRPASSRDNQSGGTSKMRYAPSSAGAGGGRPAAARAAPPARSPRSPRSPRRSPRSRRPLMRAGGGAARRARPPRDSEITTMVEAVGTCTSSHISREPSPGPSPRRRTVNNTPRTARTNTSNIQRKPLTTCRPKIRTLSPKAKLRRSSPKSPALKALDNIKTLHETDTNRSEITNKTYVKENAAVKNINDLHQKVKNLEKNDKSVIDKNIANATLDKKDKTSGRVVKDASSKDCESADCTTKGMASDKDFDSWKDFESNEFDCKSSGTARDMSTSTKNPGIGGKEYAKKVVETPRSDKEEERDGSRSSREKKASSMAPARCEVTRLLRQLCSGDTSGNRNESVSGAKNAQLHFVSGGSPRPPSTPQLLRILEETIQKKAPKPMYQARGDPDRFRMTFNVADHVADSMLQYRTKYVQHMLASSLYANSAVGKPWEMVGSVSDKIIEELLAGCSKEMQIRDVVHNLYLSETNG